MNTTLQQPVSPETREVMIALQGLWEFDDPIDGPFIVDWQDLSTFQNYIDNFKNNARGQKIPFFAVHADKTEAAGWLEDMYMAPAVDDNGLPILDEDGKQRTALMGLAEWNSLGQHKIADKQFLYLSPSFQGVWQNPLTKIMYQDVIFEISMTNSPMQKYLKQLKLSERNKVKECDKSKLVNFSEKRKETMATMSDFEIDPEKKKIIEGAQASKEDMKNDKAGAGLSESGAEKVEPPKKTVDEKLKQFEEMLSELSGEFKGKSGNPHAKALGKILSSQYKSLKEKYFPDEEPGDKPGEASEKEPCSGKMSESKEKEKISMSEKRMLSELAELKAFRREAVVDKGMAELEKLDMVKPGEAEFLRNKLISLYPMPAPTAISFIKLLIENGLPIFAGFDLSNQTFPASANKAPFRKRIIVKRYSAFSSIFTSPPNCKKPKLSFCWL